MKLKNILTGSSPFRSLLLTVILYIVLNSCSDQKMTPAFNNVNGGVASSSTQNNLVQGATIFTKNVGAPIDRVTALHWIDNFTSKSSGIKKEFSIPAKTLEKILSDSSCVGISLSYATDNSGQLHILPMGVGANGRTLYVNNILLGDNTVIEWATAQQWIANYTGEIRSHFFGSLTFDRLLMKQQAKNIRVTLALDNSGNPQLLLSDASQTDPTSYEDKSSPCPPVCV